MTQEVHVYYLETRRWYWAAIRRSWVPPWIADLLGDLVKLPGLRWLLTEPFGERLSKVVGPAVFDTRGAPRAPRSGNARRLTA